jgi:hypothetical protein
MRHILTGVLAIMFLNGTAAAKPFKEMFPGVTFEPADAQTFLESLDYKQGDVPISVADRTV